MINIQNYISVDPEICHGKPCFKGTRIMAASVLELLEAGESYDQILEGYPGLTHDHIRAALHLASELLDHEQTLPLQAA